MAQTMRTSSMICEACNISVHEKSFKQHLDGKKHKIKQDQYDKKYKTIFVTGTNHLSPNELEQIFMKYGKVSKVNKNKTKPFAFIQFDTQDSVEKALKGRIFSRGKKLFVHRYQDDRYRSDNQEQNNEKSRKLSETLSNTSQTEGEGSGLGVKELPVKIADPELCSEGDVLLWQARNFVSQVELTNEMYQSLNEVKSDVENIFRTLFPGCQVIVFGSCGSTLAFRNSDVDLFLRTASGEQPQDFVRREAKEMYRSRLFRVIARIPLARVPIVKFEHVGTGWQGDLTANSQLGVRNTQLIRFLVSLDPRIKPLIMVIKYWAKVCGVTGSHSRFTTYSLVMLVIFYLQQLDPPMLPTIAKLQQMTQQKELCQGWECSFCDEEWRVQSECLSQPNNLSLRQLLTGFFKFYYNFDLNNVICPLLGKSIPVQEFEDEGNDLPPEMFLYEEKLKSDPKTKFRTDVNFRVQDPFELCLNITRNVADKTCSVFREGCRVSLELCEKEKDSDLLTSLFSIDEESLDINGESINITIYYKEPIESSEVSENSFELWYQQTAESILLVLKRIYKLSVDTQSDKILSKVKKVEATQDVHTQINNHSDKKLVFKCNGNSNTWNCRKKMSKLMKFLNSALNPFEMEVCISNALYNPDDNNLFFFKLSITSGELKNGTKGIEIRISALKSALKGALNPLVKGFIQSIKNELRHYVIKAQNFIKEVKASSPLTEVKESLEDLFELKLKNLPDLREMKIKNDEFLASIGKEDKVDEGRKLISKPTNSIDKKNNLHEQSEINSGLKTTDSTKLLERTRERNYEQEVEQKGEILCTELKQSEDVEHGEFKDLLLSENMPSSETQVLIDNFFKSGSHTQKNDFHESDKCSETTEVDKFSELLNYIKKNETESTLTSDKVNPFLASIERVASKALNVGCIEIVDIVKENSESIEGKKVGTDEFKSNTERKKAKNFESLEKDSENIEFNTKTHESENCSEINKNSSTSSESKIEENKVENLESGLKKQNDDTKLSLERPNIHSERPMKLKKPNSKGLNQNEGQPKNHSQNGSRWQPWAGGGPPGCQPWKPHPPDPECQGPNSIMQQKKWYPGLFGKETS